MLKAKSARLLTLIVAGGTLFAACSGTSAAPSVAPSAAPSEAASAAPSVELGQLPVPEQTSVKIGLSVTEMSQFASKLAEVEGIYKKNGITNVEVSVFEGDGKTMQALQAGQLDVAMVGVSSSISSQVTDAPVVTLSVNAVILTDDIVSTKDIKTADDLKGKAVAISTFGGTSNGSALLGIKALGLTTSDVVITQVGKQDVRIAALQGGSVGAAVVDSNLEEDMKAQGFNILVQLKEAGLQWGRSGMAVRKDWYKANPNTALVLVASALEAQNMVWTNPDEVAAKFAEFNQIDIEKAKAQVADFQTIGNRSMTWKDDAFQNPKEVLATVNPDIANVPIADAYDRSILEKLKTIGFYEKIGSPAP